VDGVCATAKAKSKKGKTHSLQAVMGVDFKLRLSGLQGHTQRPTPRLVSGKVPCAKIHFGDYLVNQALIDLATLFLPFLAVIPCTLTVKLKAHTTAASFVAVRFLTKTLSGETQGHEDVPRAIASTLIGEARHDNHPGPRM
jgi:hypothetical protein